MDKNYNSNKFLHTSDLGCAAALICEGYKLVDVDKTNPAKVDFIFPNSEKVRTAMQDFVTGDSKVCAKQYFDTLKHLKSLIYSR